MSEPKFTLLIKKFVKNPLLHRNQLALTLHHSQLANVTKDQVADVLASKLKAKANAISVFGLKTKFGGGSSTGFALIYDSQDMKKDYDFKYRVIKAGLKEKVKGQGRRNKKDIKHKRMKLRGIKKSKATAGKPKR